MNIFFTLLIIGIGFLLFYLKQLFNYWKLRGIPHDAPSILMGNMDGWRTTKHMHENLDIVYKHHKGSGPFAGFFFFLKPMVLALDLDFIKNVLIKDFNNFVNRGIYYNERDDPLTGHLFAIENDKWRSIRSKISPTFTTGKMKQMYPTVLQVAEELVRVLDARLDENKGVINVVDLVARYTADGIGLCAFGIECNSLRNEKADFVIMGKKAIIERNHHRYIDNLIEAFPDAARKLGMRQLHPDCVDFYMRIVRETIEFRRKYDIKRNDFVDTLLNINRDDGNEGLTLNEMAAQCFAFFLGGFDTSSTTMGYALYELAKNPHIQNLARTELIETLKMHDNEFTYEWMNNLKYLQQVISETLRMYPIVPNLMRKANEHYTTDIEKYFVEKGTTVLIPAFAIHHDPDIYPEPEKFDPTRFTDENNRNRHSCAYLPFGEGPRNCIGMRFGKMQTSLGLAQLLLNFKFSLNDDKAPRLDITSPLLNIEGDIHIKFEKIT